MVTRSKLAKLFFSFFEHVYFPLSQKSIHHPDYGLMKHLSVSFNMFNQCEHAYSYTLNITLRKNMDITPTKQSL